jgi:hypothetical protein
MCFAPRHSTTADSFQLISAYESGNLVRWDLRMPKNPIERLMAHQGGVLSVDWKGASENSHIMTDASSEEGRASPGHSWGWLATAGMDGTVKVSWITFDVQYIANLLDQVWDMSAAGHTPQLAHTLHVGRPSHFVRWSSDPNSPCDLIVTPSPMTGSTVGSFDDSWQPDVEIWDVRREYLPKQNFWLGGSPVCKPSLTLITTIKSHTNRSLQLRSVLYQIQMCCGASTARQPLCSKLTLFAKLSAPLIIYLA